MTTELPTPQTRMLHDILWYGVDAAMSFGLCVQEGWTDEQMIKAAHHLDMAISLAQQDSWGRSEEALDRAYQALGGENPGSGYEFYLGWHPIQGATHKGERP